MNNPCLGGVSKMSEATNQFTNAEVYEKLMGRWSRQVGDEFLDWLDAPKGMKWLDVGCGNGAFTERLISRCAPTEVIAIDPSHEQLAYARTRRGTEVAKFQSGDAQKLPFAEREFDAAVMALVISFLPDPTQAVTEMVRVVRPGGWVATYMWDSLGNGSPAAPIFAAMKALGIPYSRPPSIAVSQRDALVALWEKAGLKAVEGHAIRTLISYDDFDDFWNSGFSRVGPLAKTWNKMTPGTREQLQAHLRKTMATSSDGRVTYQVVANAVKGRLPEPS